MSRSTSLPLELNTHYQEILKATRPFLTNKEKTGILDNTQRADQDQEQVGQLTFLTIGIASLANQIEKLNNTIEKLEAQLKYRPPTTSPIGGGTSTSGPQIGTSFISYNPPEK